MIFYAIRHKPTGFYLPQGGNRHTKDEPKKDCIPRLFKRKCDAANALKWWLEGMWGNYHYSATYEQPESYRIEVVKQPHRKAEEMEIIQVSLCDYVVNFKVDLEEPCKNNVNINAVQSAIIDLVTEKR